MNLREYLKRSKIKHYVFAEKIGISKGHVWQILSGKRGASKKLATRIEEATEGAVTAYEVIHPEGAPPLLGIPLIEKRLSDLEKKVEALESNGG